MCGVAAGKSLEKCFLTLPRTPCSLLKYAKLFLKEANGEQAAVELGSWESEEIVQTWLKRG